MTTVSRAVWAVTATLALAFSVATRAHAASSSGRDLVRDLAAYLKSPPGAKRDALAAQLREAWSGVPVAELREAFREVFPLRKPRGEGGTVRDAARAEGVGFPYAEYPYSVHLPARYDPKKPWPALFWVEEHGTEDGGSAVWQRELPGHLLVSPRMPADDPKYRELPSFPTSHAFLEAVMRDVGAKYSLDADRVAVGGFSHGGSVAWSYAAFLGDRLCAAVPVAGYPVGDPELVRNSAGIGFWVAYGGRDPTLEEATAKAPIPVLERLGNEVVWDYDPKGGHRLSPASKPRVARWLLERRRAPNPRSLVQAYDPTANPWGRYYWVRLTRWKGLVEVKAAIGPENTVDLEARGEELKGLEVYLSDELVDVSRPVVVRVNGTEVHSGPVRPDPVLALELWMERRDPALVYTVRLSFDGEANLAR